MTIARETSMAIHSRADRWGSRVPEDEGGHIREMLEPFHSTTKHALFSNVFQRRKNIRYLVFMVLYHICVIT